MGERIFNLVGRGIKRSWQLLGGGAWFALFSYEFLSISIKISRSIIRYTSGVVQDYQAQEGDVSGSGWCGSSGQDEPAKRQEVQICKGSTGSHQEGPPGEGSGKARRLGWEGSLFGEARWKALQRRLGWEGSLGEARWKALQRRLGWEGSVLVRLGGRPSRGGWDWKAGTMVQILLEELNFRTVIN